MFGFLSGLFEYLIDSKMTYLSLKYLLLVGVTLIFYFALPKKYRWLALMVANAYFVYAINPNYWQLVVFAASIVVTFLFSLLLTKNKNKYLLVAGIAMSTAPLICWKVGDLITSSIFYIENVSWIVPLGLSFYSMQMIAYLSDIYRDKLSPQINFFKYFTYMSFFPIIIQGPITKYQDISKKLFCEESEDIDPLKDEGFGNGWVGVSKDYFRNGLCLVLWGLFLKYIISDRSAVVANEIFNNYPTYKGMYILFGAVFYSVQLYTDFMSCVCISRGVANFFGIDLIDNFKQPYFATSIKDFWRRWHISFSTWLRDYVYIPLGGNKKGKVRKFINVAITFLVSGLWHGGAWKYLFWGLLHAIYQIVGDFIIKTKESMYNSLGLHKESRINVYVSRVITFFLVMIGWIIFRANDLVTGFRMIGSLFYPINPWIFTNGEIFKLGLAKVELNVLIFGVVTLIIVSSIKERNIDLKKWFSNQNIVVRWGVYFTLIIVIWLFGTYGNTYNASDFIYGGF